MVVEDSLCHKKYDIIIDWFHEFYCGEIQDENGRISRIKVGFSNYTNNLRYILVALWNIIINRDYSYYGAFEQYSFSPDDAEKLYPRKR